MPAEQLFAVAGLGLAAAVLTVVLLRRRRTAAAGNAPGSPQPGPQRLVVARVHATLDPRGLVDVGGVLQPASWHGEPPGPRRGCLVYACPPADGPLWLVTGVHTDLAQLGPVSDDPRPGVPA